MPNSHEEKNEKAVVGGRAITNLRFADIIHALTLKKGREWKP